MIFRKKSKKKFFQKFSKIFFSISTFSNFLKFCHELSLFLNYFKSSVNILFLFNKLTKIIGLKIMCLTDYLWLMKVKSLKFFKN